MTGGLRQWLTRLGRTDDQLEAEALSDSSDACGARHADQCCQGEVVMVQGRLRSVDLRPADSLATLVAELYDGTDTLQLIWLGRRSIPGVEPGRTIRVKGRVANRDGAKCMFNPDYELRPALV